MLFLFALENDVLYWNCRTIACKNRKLDNSSRFSDIRGTFSESGNFSESSYKDPEFETRIKSKVSEGFEHIRIQIQRSVATYKYCCVYYKAQDLTVVPKQPRMQSYVRKRIYIPEGNRCCRARLIKGRFFNEELSRLRVYSNFAKVKDSELSELLEGLTIECDTMILDRVENREFFIGRKSTSFYRFAMGKYYRNARNANVSAKQSNPRCNTSSRRVLIKIKIRKIQQNDCCTFAIRTRTPCFRLCRFYHELF